MHRTTTSNTIFNIKEIPKILKLGIELMTSMRNLEEMEDITNSSSANRRRASFHSDFPRNPQNYPDEKHELSVADKMKLTQIKKMNR